MRAAAALLACFLGLTAVHAFARTPGVFQGEVVRAAHAQDSRWLYIHGRNGSLRRVDVQEAEFVYGDEVPEAAREATVPRQLSAGTIVRVTAEQGSAGEWRASRVEIIRLAASKP